MKTVQILLSTYNGEKYLEKQLESLVSQKDVNVSILVRDDGSVDSTKEILKKWEGKGLIEWYEGNNLKSARSFLDLIQNAEEKDYYAFCDQDDYWESNKVATAIKKIKKMETIKPALYYSEVTPVDEKLNEIEIKRNIQHKCSFGKAIIHSYVTGCTMVFNRLLLNLIKKFKPNNIRMHDQWVFLVCSAVKGEIIYDENSYIKYRQHENNVVGINNDFKKRIPKLISSFRREKKERKLQVSELMRGYEKEMPYENLKLVKKVVSYDNSIKQTLSLLLDKEIKSNSKKINVLFFLSVITRSF